MDLKSIEHNIEDAAADIEKGAKSLFATATSAVSSFLGLANPKWKQFVAEWRIWTWTKRGAFLAVAALITFAGVRYGVRVVDIASGNLQAARAYARGDVVTKADVESVKSDADKRLRQAEANYKAGVGALKQKVDALGEKFDGLSDSVRQLQLEVGALEEANASKPAARITTGSIARKPVAAKPKAAAAPTIWDQMKAVMP